MIADIAHGGRLIAARARHADAPEPFFDLSTGINPRAYRTAQIPPECLARLPEPEEEQALRVAAARCYGVADPSMVAAAPGTQAIISMLPLLYRGRLVGILSPTYGEYSACWGKEAVAVGSVQALADFDVAVICNPNNPDGRIVPAKTLLALATHLAGRGGFLLVDEAFADFVPGVSLASYLPHPGLILLRSFGKTFGLAGLRLGFALADSAYVTTLRHAFGPWAVSGPALWIGCQALIDQVWINQAGAALGSASVRLDAMLERAGLAVIGGTPLFRLAHAAGADLIAKQLGDAGILVRRFPAHPTWLRFGIPGDDRCWNRLATALQPV